MTGNSQISSESQRVAVEHYLSVVAHRVRVLIGRLGEAAQPTHALVATATLKEILERMLSRFFDELRSLHQELDDQPPEDIVRQARTIHYVTVAIVPELIEALRMAGSDSPAASVIEAYQHLGGLVQYGTQTIIHPSSDYNATFDEIMKTLRTMTRSLRRDTGEAIFSGAPRSFLLITYPIAEEEMVLRHAFLAHEMGHFIDLTEGLSRTLLEEQLFDGSDRTNIHEAVQCQGGGTDRDEIFEEAVVLAGEIAPRWIEEIVADVLAVLILGPAYLLAFDEVSLSPRYSSPRRIHRSHPPAQLRKNIMRELILELHLDPIRSSQVLGSLSREELDVFNDVCQWIDATVETHPMEFASISNAPDLGAEVIAAIYATLRNVVMRLVERIRDEQLERIRMREWACTHTDVLDALRLQQLLSYGLTPSELYSGDNRDPSFAAVMNSGWFHFLHMEQDYLYFRHGLQESHPDEIRDKYVNLQNLIAKAVESLQFKREFFRRKETVEEGTL
jgi:hypothetical protein